MTIPGGLERIGAWSSKPRHGLKGAAACRDQAMDFFSPEQLNELSLQQLWELAFAVLNAIDAKLGSTPDQPVAENSSSYTSRLLVFACSC